MAGERKRILVVEDDPDILRILTHMLGSAGYEVAPGYGGHDAIRKALRQHFDLVVTDLAMPRVSGVEVIDAVKSDEGTADVPVIAVTAHRMDPITDSAAYAGCDAFVSKPFRAGELLTEVARLLDEAERRREHRKSSAGE